MAIAHDKTFELDISPGGNPPVIHASQGDIGRTFKASIVNSGYSIPSNVSISLRGKKPDNTVFDYDESSAAGITYDEDYDTVTFSTTEQMTIISGPVECEFVFTLDSSIVATANFVLIVEGSPYDPDALSTSDVTALSDAVAGMMDDAIDAKLDAYEAQTANIADGAVTTAKLVDSSVTSDKIADGAVDTDDIADSAVTNEKLANNSVTSSNIVDGEVKTADIADNAVTAAKLEADLRAAIVEIQAIINNGMTTGGVLFSQGAVTLSQGRLVLNNIN